jgi:chromosomal replication initiator protein
VTISVAAASASAEPARPDGPTLASILEAVSLRFGIPAKEITGTGRARRLTSPRHVCLFLAKKLTPHSLQEIATFFGGLNHATVLYACRKVEEEMAKSGAARKQVEEAERVAAGAVSG